MGGGPIHESKLITSRMAPPPISPALLYPLISNFLQIPTPVSAC